MHHLKVHHLGYLVKKRDAAKKAFEALGYAVESDWVRDEARGIDICFMTMDSLRVELVCPFTKDSDVSSLLSRIKNSPYHICYETPSIADEMPLLRAEGYLPIKESAPAPACGGRNVAFFLHPALGMIELLELSCP